MSFKLLGMLVGCSVLQPSAVAQDITVKLNGGLEATVLQIGRTRDHRNVTLSLRISNKGSSTAYLILVDNPMATDNTGGIFKDPVVSGITYCHYGVWAASYCIGIPEKHDWTVPIQSFTEIDPNPDPNAGITVNFRLTGQGDGTVASFSAHLYVRFVSDTLKDAAVPEAAKYKEFRMMTLSFPPMHVKDAQ